MLLDCFKTILDAEATHEPPARPGIISSHAIPEAKKRSIRILVVEDNVVNQQVAIKMLETMGCRVHAAGDGQGALKSLQNLPYDLVLMDCQMPVMDGLEAARRVRAPESGVLDSSIPIIAMTAHATTEDRKKCFDAGMDAYLTKPVEPEKLAATINRLLENKISSREKTSTTAEIAKHQKLSPVFDRDGLFNRMLNDINLVNEVVTTFLEDAPLQLKTLNNAVNRGDANAVQRTAHTIGGASGNISARALRQVASEMELAGRESDLGRAKDLMGQINEHFETLKGVLLQEGLAQGRADHE